MKYIFIISTLLFLSSCVYEDGGYKAYKAKVENLDVKDSLSRLDIKYLSPNVYGIYWTDFYRENGFFAYNVYELNKQMYFKKIDSKFEEKWKLVPDFTLWERFGFIIVLILLVLFFKYYDTSN